MFPKKSAPFFAAIFLLSSVFVLGLASYLYPIPQDAHIGDSNVTPTPFTVQQWADGVTKIKGKGVSLNLGDRAGGGGSEDDNHLCILLMAHELDRYPKATTFIVEWGYTVAMGTDNFKLIYNRKRGVINFYPGWRPKLVAPDGHPINGVTDAMIHATAKRYDSYLNVKSGF